MKLSTRSRYGTRLMLDMAQHYNEGPIQLGDIAKRQDVSVKYLEQIIISLKKARYIESVRGPKGGHILTRPPSAELKPHQTDQDTLPPYEVLDDILACLIEGDLGIDDIVARGHKRGVVQAVWHMVDTAEYKRRQAPPGVKVTRRAFGRERRYPITNAFKGAS